MQATHLQVEYLTEPLGLGETRPRFSWHCREGIAQTAYRIVCRRRGEEIWDTGRVESADMTHIIYGGQPLGSRDRVQWAVTLWDENNTPGKTAESWFEIGLLCEDDWKAAWITGDYKPGKRQRYPVDCFQKNFRLCKPVAYARLYATALGVYDVTINGIRLEEYILSPGMTDYRKRIQYQTYDVTRMLNDQNTIAFQLADGWYRGSSAAYGVTCVYGTATSLAAQLEVFYTDGSSLTVATDATWSWSNDGPLRFADLKDGEVYDVRMTPSFGGHARPAPRPKVLPAASDNVPVREKERFVPTVLTSSNGARVLDFGQNMAGYPEFTVKGKPGQQLRFILGEILDENGHVDLHQVQETVPSRQYSNAAMMVKLLTGKVIGRSRQTPLQEIRLTCSGREDHYKTRFSVFGFRYMEIIGDIEIDPAEFAAIAVYSDMEQTGDFECSDAGINRLLENTRWSMKSNFLEIPTDCPTRERLGWTGDAQIFFDTGSYLMNTAPFFQKWLRDMQDAQYDDGIIPAVLPYQGMEMMYRGTAVSVGWADAVYLVPYRFYKRYGDIAVLQRCWPMMERYAGFLMGHLGMADKKAAAENPYNLYTYEKGLHLGEWLEPEEYKEKISAGKHPAHPEECTAYFFLAMTTMAEIAGLLGYTEKQEQYRRYAEGAQKAYAHLFVSTGKMDTDRQAKLVRPLAFGLMDNDPDAKKAAQKRLVLAVENNRNHVATGFLSTAFLLPVLEEAGAAETAYKLLRNTEKPGWMYEIAQGATTLWESWEGDGSRNHYSPGAVCQWLFEGVAGIRLAAPRRFRIAPQPGGGLDYASASYKSLYGMVESRWERSAGRTSYTVIIPANCTAELVLPGGQIHALSAGTYHFITEG